MNLATGLYVKQGVKSQLLPTDWSSYHPQYGVANIKAVHLWSLEKTEKK